MRDFQNVRAAFQNAFGEKETGGELFIVAGRAHCDRNGIAADADFEWFFDSNRIDFRLRVRVGRDASDIDLGAGVIGHLTDALALGEFIELLQAVAGSLGIETPYDASVDLDELGAAFFVVANIDSVRGGTCNAWFRKMHLLAVMARHETNIFLKGPNLRRKIALCHLCARS